MEILPGTQLDRYVIQGILGEGAMAVVYQAMHAELGSLHAIKRLKLPSQKIRERLIQEGRLQSSLHHPNVLSVTDLLSVDGAPALVMEFVAGPTLADLMSIQPLSLEQSDALARDLLKGVVAAHAHGLIHRDLKPANILIAVTGDALIPKIADFGLAKIMETDENHAPMTRTGATMGTPAYMAPEQIRDSSTVDARADVFSLGAILYELATGKTCFVGDSVMEIWEQICGGQFQPVAELQPDLPPRMIRAIEGSLMVDPDQRIETVADLFECWCSDEQGQHVEVPGRQSLGFWSEDLRSDASAMAPTLDRTDSHGSPHEEGDSSTMVFVADQSADQPIRGPDSASTLAPPPAPGPPKTATKGMIAMVLMAIAVLIAILWSQRQTPEAEAPSPSSAQSAEGPASPPTANLEASKPAPSSPNDSLIFSLGEDASEAEQQTMASAQEALLSGDFPRAERSLGALLESHPDEPGLHSLLALTHYFRGRGGLSASSARRASHLSRDDDSPAGRLFDLSDRSWREVDNTEGIPARWAAFRSAYPGPLVDLFYLVSSRLVLKTTGTLEQIRAVRKQRPEWAVWTVMELGILDESGQLDELLKAAEAGLERFPAATRLRLGMASALVQLDLTDEAFPHLQRVLQEDSNLTAARALLAEIYLSRGDESERLKQTVIALGDTTPPHEQVLYLWTHGQQLAARGLLDEADRHWRLCTEIAREAGNFNGALDCSVESMKATIWLRPVELWDPLQAQLREAVTHPAVDADLKQFYSVFLIMTEAFASARAGELENAVAALAQIEALDDQQNPLDIRRIFAREIRREIAIAQRNPTQLGELMTQLPSSNKNPDLPRACISFYNEVKLRRALDETTAATALAEQILRGECRPGSEQSWIEAQLRSELATWKLRRGDLEATRELVQDFDQDWPNPDADLSAVLAIEAVREKL
jgi:serine/threonine protein kinase/tetratricopeptide (TPR) repeat protein